MKSILNRVLTLILILLVLCIAIVTGVSFATKSAKPGRNIRVPDPEPGAVVNMTSSNNEKLLAFTGLGNLRAVTKPNPKKEGDIGTTIIISPWFSYREGDSAFYEELAKKSTMMRSIIMQYFSQYTEKEIIDIGEDKIKEDLCNQINEKLSLDKIDTLYFSEYFFIVP